VNNESVQQPSENSKPSPALEMSDAVLEPYDALEADDGVYVLPEDSGVFMPPPEVVAQMLQAPPTEVLPPEGSPAPSQPDVSVSSQPVLPAPSQPVVSATDAPEFLEGDFLEEEVLAPTVPPNTSPTLAVPPIMKLERGEYALLTQESPGRVIAKAPDGSEVRVAIYTRGADVTRALYPHPMLPNLIDAGEYEGKILIAHPKLEGNTLDAAIYAKDKLAVIAAVVDLARLNRYLHARGFAFVSIDPRDVLLSPTRLQRLPNVHKIGEAVSAEAPRYGAPERAAGHKVNGTEGVYVLGGLIYHVLTGQMPVEGEMLLSFPEIPAVPQALTAMLAPATTRVNPTDALELCSKLERAFDKRYAWVLGTASTVGINPDRTTNEDSTGYRARRSLGAAHSDSIVVACVADGIGGMAKGEDASQAAVSGFLDFPLFEVSTHAAQEAISLANARVMGALEGKSGGCTFTGIIADGNKIALAHVGDTRAYVVTDTVRQISEDHSMVAMFVKMGIITPEAAHNHPDSNKIMRALGSHRELPPDYVHLSELTIEENAKIVIVSDGVWGVFPPKEFETALLEPLEVQDLADSLVRQSLKRSTSDNATALVMKLEIREPI
jgi:PPM family protein phosphatase